MIERPAMMDLPRPAPPERAQRDPRPAGNGFERLLGAAADDVPGAPREGNALEIAFDDAEGGGQSIVLPWRLFANDALSQLLQATGEGATARTMPNGAAGRSAGTVASDAVGNGSAAAIAQFTIMSSDEAVLPPIAMPASTPSGHSARISNPAMPAALSSLAEPWQVRLLRWMESADGGLLARLRDYRLDAAGEARCVERIVSFAREHGLQLQRVVVNAREVWRAPR